jgi:FKBP-type peptidyl-prolyl cis-trans isomerase FklB
MKIRYLIFPVVAFGLGVATAQAADQTELKDQRQKASYAIGSNIGTTWKSQDIDLDLDVVMRGLKDALAGNKLLMSDQEKREVLGTFQKEARAKWEEKRKLLGEKNLKDGEAFLAANKAKSGIVTLPSGLQYKVVKEGTGEMPKANDRAKVNYRGSLIDGTEFDSSPTNQPAIFTVKGVIKGWTEALQLMKVGAKWQLFSPPNLAYGAAGSGAKIGPNSVLIFDVELAGVEPNPVASQAESSPVTSDIIKVPSAEEMKKGAKIEVIKKEDLEKKKEEADKK